MQVIGVSKKHQYGNNIFHIGILYPGEALGMADTGFYTIGRIDHANFKPPGVVQMHLHRDDEILSYIRSGVMVHEDSADHRETLDASRMMMMNAGSGVQHEESAEQDIEMLQIFMRPCENGLEPKVQFHKFENIYNENQWRLVAGNDKAAPLQLRSETNIFDVRLSTNSSLHVPGLYAEKAIHLLYCFNGGVSVDGFTLNKGDCITFHAEMQEIKALQQSDLVLFQIKEGAKFSITGMFSGDQNRSRTKARI